MPPKPAEAAEKAAQEAEIAQAAEKLKEQAKLDAGGGSITDLPLVTVAPAQPRARPSIAWPLLTRSNYTIWAMKMRVALQAARVWEAIERTDVEYEVDREALFGIYSAVLDSVMASLAGLDTAKAAWDAIKVANVGHDHVREASLQSLRLEFEELQMGDDESIDGFATRINTLIAGIRSLGENLPELRVVQKFLAAAPARFMHIVTSIEQCVPLDTLSVEDLVGRYKAHEERLRARFGDPKSGEHLMLSRAQWESYINKKKASEGSSSSSRPQRFEPKSDRGSQKVDQKKEWKFDIKKVKCHNCGRKGHFKKDCTEPKKQRVFVAEKEGDVPEVALLMIQACELTQVAEEASREIFLNEEKVKLHRHDRCGDQVWYLDTGASNHMTGCEEKFTDIDFSVKGKVKFGDGSTVEITGRGTILFQCLNGEHRELSNVYLIPALKSNIISLGQMSENGCKVILEDMFLWMYDRDRILLAKVCRSPNRLYLLDLSLTKPVCLMARLEDMAWLWHARYGHLNFKSLRKLANENMVIGLPHIHHVEQICDGCLVGKQRRTSFPINASYRAEEVLDLVHGDICGPISPATPGCKRYFLLVVDDNSRFMWVALLRSKDEALESFQKISKRAEAEANRKVKALRTDRGGEFNSKRFAAYCDERGMMHYLTAPYSPQQNGVVERRNQTIVSMAQSLLKSKDMPGTLWGEAVSTAVYILNRSPTKSVQGKTPYEAWHGRKPNIHHLRTFGCVAYAKVTKPNQGKLADRSVKTVMLGYEPGSKAYRLYDPSSKKVIVSRDVVFDESKQWDWSGVKALEEELAAEIFTIADHVNGTERNVESSELELQPEPVIPVITTQRRGNGECVSDAIPESPAVEATPENDVGETSAESESSASVGPQGYRKVQELLDSVPLCDLNDEELCMIGAEEPSSLAEAQGEVCWRRAMDQEMSSIRENETWNLVDKPPGQNVVGLKWVYKLKKDPSGAVIKHKARLVAKGYVQKPGVDYEEVFAPVARMDTVRLLVALAAQESWELHHMDVKSAFLNGELQEEVFVSQPPGYELKGSEHKVLKLKKALYGLQQAPRAWTIKLDESLLNLGFERCPLEHALYLNNAGNACLLVGVYVDDLVITGSSNEEILKFKGQMKNLFQMSDLGLLSYYLGIEVAQTANGITLCQSSYALNILEKRGMTECNPCQVPMEPRLKLWKSDQAKKVDATHYRSIVGSLRYLVNTRPDLAYAVGIVSRYMESPSVHHMAAVKQVLRYVKGSVNLGCHYGRKEEEVQPRLIGYSDSDHAGDVNDRKSTSGVVFFLGSNLVTWVSQKQKVVAVSSCEAEYIAASNRQAIWLSRLLAQINSEEPQQVTIMVDNKSAISLCKNPVLHDRSKHIDTLYHFIRDSVEEKRINVLHIRTEEQLADILTKSLAHTQFLKMREKIGLRPVRMQTVQD